MAASKIYKDDIGTVFKVNVGSSMAAATTTELRVKKQDGTIVVWTATVNGVLDTQLDYTIVSGDLDMAGPYLLNAYVVTNSGTWRGETVKFTAYDRFE